MDVVARLRLIAALKVGDPMPAWLGPNVWGQALSALCAEAASEIEVLRNRQRPAIADDTDSENIERIG